MKLSVSRALVPMLFVLGLALGAGPAPATTVSLVADPAAVPVGGSFAVDVHVADVTDLFAFQFDLAFDPAVVQASAVLEGGFLASGGGVTSFIPGSIDNGAGTVSFTANTLLGPAGAASGDGVIVRLLFQALAEGHSELLLGNLVLLDAALADIDATVGSGRVTVAAPNAVPEPASALLAAFALAALGAKTSRRSAGARAGAPARR